jgi:hypothetical protein
MVPNTGVTLRDMRLDAPVAVKPMVVEPLLLAADDAVVVGSRW